MTDREDTAAKIHALIAPFNKKGIEVSEETGWQYQPEQTTRRSQGTFCPLAVMVRAATSTSVTALWRRRTIPPSPTRS